MLLKLGDLKFHISTAAYNEFTETFGFTWSEQAIVAGDPQLQYVGNKAKVVTLKGDIFPAIAPLKRGETALATPIKEAGRGKVFQLTSGIGMNLGKWVIENVKLTKKYFFKDGTPKQISFDITLKQYSKV